MDEKERKVCMYDQWLQSMRNLSERSAKRILTAFPEPEALLGVTKERLEELLTVGQANILMDAIKGTGSVGRMEEQFEKLKEKGVAYVSSRQAVFPRSLTEIPDAPLGIYYLGKLPEEETLSVAVVGSRDCSEYGSFVARELGRFLGEKGVYVISGMARGIDGISQQAALEAGGESFGVLGCGVDVCYPASNRGLYDRLLERGGILSTYPPGTPPIGKNFPPRNRIVSGLADALVVVEARLKSGTLITVDMALEQGREVYVVPGRVTDRLSDGCNKLLKQGAGVFSDPESFLEELQELFFRKKIAPGKKRAGREKAPERTPSGLSEELLSIWRLLDNTPKPVEEIAGRLQQHLTVPQCGIALMQLVLEGHAKQVTAGYFCRA